MRGFLKNKKVLIVGGSSGIGLAVAGHALRNGAYVITASRHAAERRVELAGMLEGSIETHAFDITSLKDHRRLFEAIGVIDHLIVTVRPEIKPAPFHAIDIEKAKQAFETKFWGQYQLIQMAQHNIRETGSITLTSGIAGEKIYKEASTMALINSATETLCRVLAVELAPLRINVVSPGFVEPKPQEIVEYATRFPAGKIGSLDDVAMAYIYLMTNPYTTGTVTVVDGGARLI